MRPLISKIGLFASLLLLGSTTQAQMMRPMMMPGAIPGMAQFQAIQTSRHQARTLLYREALEELKKNPRAADLADCPANAKNTSASNCIPVAQEISHAPASIKARKVALLIGNNDYLAPIPSLETPIIDIDKIGETLSNTFGYQTHILKNGKKHEIVQALIRIADEAQPDDSILLMYAGHGYLKDDDNTGYWIPSDASTKTAANWISNTDIVKFLQAIPVKQLILVSDSCFSGTLTREQKVSENTQLEREHLLRQRAVMVMSSGGEEPVSDEGKDGHSIFAWSLITTLKELGNGSTGFSLYKEVKRKVMADYPQEPQYGAVVTAGHTPGSEYLFDPQAKK